MVRSLLVGKIVGVHGIKGVLKVQSYAESLDVYTSGHLLLAKRENRPGIACKVNWAKPHKRIVLISLENIETIDQAREFVGSELSIDRSLLPPPEEDTYYWFDIIGLSVFGMDQRYLGKIESIIPTGGNDVYVVKRSGSEVLIPAIASVVKAIDLERNTMRVEMPEGLL